VTDNSFDKVAGVRVLGKVGALVSIARWALERPARLVLRSAGRGGRVEGVAGRFRREFTM